MSTIPLRLQVKLALDSYVLFPKFWIRAYGINYSVKSAALNLRSFYTSKEINVVPDPHFNLVRKQQGLLRILHTGQKKNVERIFLLDCVSCIYVGVPEKDDDVAVALCQRMIAEDEQQKVWSKAAFRALIDACYRSNRANVARILWEKERRVDGHASLVVANLLYKNLRYQDVLSVFKGQVGPSNLTKGALVILASSCHQIGDQNSLNSMKAILEQSKMSTLKAAAFTASLAMKQGDFRYSEKLLVAIFDQADPLVVNLRLRAMLAIGAFPQALDFLHSRTEQLNLKRNQGGVFCREVLADIRIRLTDQLSLAWFDDLSSKIADRDGYIDGNLEQLLAAYLKTNQPSVGCKRKVAAVVGRTANDDDVDSTSETLVDTGERNFRDEVLEGNQLSRTGAYTSARQLIEHLEKLSTDIPHYRSKLQELRDQQDLGPGDRTNHELSAHALLIGTNGLRDKLNEAVGKDFDDAFWSALISWSYQILSGYVHLDRDFEGPFPSIGAVLNEEYDDLGQILKIFFEATQVVVEENRLMKEEDALKYFGDEE